VYPKVAKNKQILFFSEIAGRRFAVGF